MIPELGVIEGYFGRPWHHEDRKRVVAQLRELGLHLRGFSGRPSEIATGVAAHAINPSLQPHLTLIPAATLVASYREGSAYCYMRAFREAARALADLELAPMLEEDLHAFQDRGIDQLGDEREHLRQRYLAVDHPMAAEVVRWLEGSDTADRWVEDA